MSTYASQPYTFAVLDHVEDATSCSEISSFVTKLKNTFDEGGWDITTIGPRLVIRTNANDGFAFCTLGTGDVGFYRVSLSSGGFYAIIDQDAVGDCVTDCTIGPYVVISAQTARDELHTAIKAILVKLYADEGITVYPLETTLENGAYTTEFVFDNVTSNCLPTVGLGNQLNSEVIGEQLQGAGFIARSQDSITDGNNVEVYCTSFADPAGGTSFITLYYKLGGWPTFSFLPGSVSDMSAFCPGETIEWTPATGVGSHPITIVEDELNTNVIGMSFELNDEDYEVWVNPHGYMYNPVGAGIGNSTRGFCAALKIKALEGEVLETDSTYPDALNIQGAKLFVRVTAGGLDLQRQLSFSNGAGCLEFSGTGFSDVSFCDAITASQWGPLIIVGYGETVSYGTHTNGVVWQGGISEIEEPWCACNFLNINSSELAPVIGQLWDCIVPYRNINLGFGNHGSAVTDIFPWDGQLWRYYQVDREGVSLSTGTGPPASLALRVSDPRIYNGTSYTGPVPATVISVSCSPNPISNGGSAVVTVTIDSAPASGAFVVVQTRGDERMRFTYPVVLASEGETTITINVTTIAMFLPDDDTVELTAKGENEVSTNVTFSGVGV